MNKRKKLFLGVIIAIVTILAIILINRQSNAETGDSNKYYIESSSETLKVNDEFSVTLVADFAEPEDSVQGRIEYSDDVELISQKQSEFCTWEEFWIFGDSLSSVSAGDNIVGFAVGRNSTTDSAGKTTRNTVTGRQKIITFKFKVVASTQGNVELKWREKTRNDIIELATLTIPRSDVESKENEKENETPNNEAGGSGNNILNVSKNTESSDLNETKKNSIIKLPQTGESFLIIILIIIVIIAVIISRKKYKKNKM